MVLPDLIFWRWCLLLSLRCGDGENYGDGAVDDGDRGGDDSNGDGDNGVGDDVDGDGDDGDVDIDGC